MKRLIIISSPDPIPNETDTINELFREGLQLFHLRKPDYSVVDINKLIENIKPEYHDRIVLPATFLKDESATLRISKKFHFFEYLRTKTSPQIFSALSVQGYTLSTSIHEAGTYEKLSSAFEYTFFGPVFDSISKQGYRAMNREQLEALQHKAATKIIALGGLDENNCLQALSYGFDGVAVLGAVWQSDQPLAVFKKIQTCIMNAQS